MSYQGFCGKYGAGKMFLGGMAAPIALSAVYNLASGSDVSVSEVSNLLRIGMLSVIAANLAHMASDKVLHRLHAGVTKGAKIVKTMQALAYAGTLAAGYTLGMASGEWNVDTNHEASKKSQNLNVGNLQKPTDVGFEFRR